MGKHFHANKIVSPILPPTVLHRPSLVDALNKAVMSASLKEMGRPLYKLVLLCAPAGYGKTTLLTDFAMHTTISCCWCFLDRTDADKIRFLELLSSSIRQRFPYFGPKLNVHLKNIIEAIANEPTQLYHLETFLDAFAAALYELSERFALILCNYHEINHDQTINHLVSRLLEQLPPQCILVLESRATPNLEFGSLLAHREIFGLGSSELSFNADEIYQLAELQGVTQLTIAEATQLAQSFGGWITGILLSTHLGDLHSLHLSDSGGSAWGSPAIRMERQHILAYLLREVFAREQEAYTFLRDTAVLRQLEPDLCNALLLINDAKARLVYLELQGLFVTRCGENTETCYHFHPVLRELLYDELRVHAPERFTALHLRAVEIFRATQDYEQAIYHALAVSAYAVAAPLIEQHYKSMFAHGYSSMLANWIDDLPQDILRQHPRLLLARANIFLTTGENARVNALLDDAYMASRSEEEYSSVIQAEILLTRSVMSSRRSDYAEAQALKQQVLSLLPEEETTLRIEAHLGLGVCECMACNFTSGIVELRQALQLCENETETRQTARLHSALASAYDMVGLHTLSVHHRARAIHCWEHLNDEWGKLDSLIGLSCTKHRQENYTEAAQLLTKVLAQTRKTMQYRHIEAYALVNLGELYQDQGHYQQALSFLEEGLSIARQVGDGYLTQSATCTLAMTYLLMGDSHTPRVLLSQLDISSPVDDAPCTYEAILYELTEGTILLWQQHYEEAYTRLARIEAILRRIGIKREHLQVAIRRAACLHALGDRTAMTNCLKDALTIVKQCGYEALYSMELSRHAEMHQEIRILPEMAHIYRLWRRKDENEQLPALPTQQESAAAENHDPTATLPAFTSAQNQPSLRVLALGEPLVYLNGTLVKRWRMQRAIELFFFLLNANQPVHKEQIIVALWPNIDEQIDQALRSSVYHLRKLLGAACIVSHRGTYKLDLPAVFGDHVWYDVEIFCKYYEVAKTALAAHDTIAARSAFQEMTRLYRGHYVQSFYSDWCAPSRNDFKYAYIDAHLQLAQIAWHDHQLDTCIAHWQHLLTVDSCLEEAHYGLINCYIQQGKRGLALRQYQHCVASLNDELAVAPGPAIQSLYQSLVHS